MNVQLISITTPTDPWVSPENLIVRIARVSSPRENKDEEADRLLGYLIRNNHWSPFEMANMCVEIVTSRAIAQQILRHRSFSFQEFSQRYAEAVDIEPVELRLQAVHNRQSSTEVIDPHIPGAAYTASEIVREAIDLSKRAYKELLSAGVAKETARFILPLTTQTRLYMNGSIRSWIHYLQMRDDTHAQLEHQRIAQDIKRIFIQEFPNISRALSWVS